MLSLVENVFEKKTFTRFALQSECCNFNQCTEVRFASFLSGGFTTMALMNPLDKRTSVHWLKLQHSDWRANLVKNFFLQINFPPMRALEFITGHVTFKLWYNQIYQMKTIMDIHPDALYK